jgi:predicted transcriptional regulator
MMVTLTITLDDEKARELAADADKLGVPVEDVARRGVHEYLDRKRAIRESAVRVLSENAELYRRLAK